MEPAENSVSPTNMKKGLSPAQLKVVSLLDQNPRDRYIRAAKSYYHQEVKDEEDEDQFNVLLYFVRPTFEVLLRRGIIRQTDKNRYKLIE